MSSLKSIVARLYQDLEDIGRNHPEVYDTDVRDHVSDVIYFFFVWGRPLDREPLDYSMFGSAGDAAVSAAVARFVRAAVLETETERIAAGVERHLAVQDRSIVTKGGRRYTHFIGHSDQPVDVQELPDYRFRSPSHD